MRCLICQMDGLPLDGVTCPGCRALLATVLRDCLPHGTLLHGGRYRLDYPLGRGGFGVTYRGVHQFLSLVVAVKEFFPQEYAYRDAVSRVVNVPTPKEAVFQKGLRRFLEEGRLLTGIRHPGVVRVLDLFEENGTAYLVMEMVGLRTLRQEIRDAGSGGLTHERTRGFMGGLVDALEAVHLAGACHLDVKPENILLNSEGRPVLADFGSARYHCGTEASTRSTIHYTESYAAPELIIGEGVGPATDLYELGVVLHELLTGSLPPGAISRLRDRRNSWQPEVHSEPWAGLLTSALGLWPEDRPASVRVWWAGSALRRTGGPARVPSLEPRVPPGVGTAPGPPREAHGKSVQAKPASVPPGLTALGRNAQGFEKYRNERDGSVLILVPEGKFTMGAEASDTEAFPEDRPAHEVDLPGYFIGKHEVTNEQFGRFVAETGHDAGTDWMEYADEWGARAPVVCVSWDDAQAYCRWMGLRLPTEAEWEKAARGTDGRRYPWGHLEDLDSRAWYAGNNGGRAHEVGKKPWGASPYGCLDMAGNVWEWCDTWYDRYPGNSDTRNDYGTKYRVLRGGSWLVDSRILRCSFRHRDSPDRRSVYNGFRVSLSRSPGPSGP